MKKINVFLFSLWLLFGMFVLGVLGANMYGKEKMERITTVQDFLVFKPTGEYYGIEIFFVPLLIYAVLTFLVGWGWLWFKEENKSIPTKRKSL